MSSCKLCTNPNMKRYEQQIWLGKATASEVAKLLQVSEQFLWVHLKEHVTQTRAESEAVGDLTSRLRIVAGVLEGRVRDLLLLPVNVSYEKDVAVQVRTLKDLLMDIARLEHAISEVPSIQVQTVIVQMNEIQQWLIENLCENDRQKFMTFLETKIKK